MSKKPTLTPAKIIFFAIKNDKKSIQAKENKFTEQIINKIILMKRKFVTNYLTSVISINKLTTIVHQDIQTF